MKKTIFDKKEIEVGSTVLKVIIKTPNSRTSRTGLVVEKTEETVTLIHSNKRVLYLISDLIGASIVGTI